MNLISCSGCGVVFDGNKLTFPDEDGYDEYKNPDEHFAWDGDGYLPILKCLLCGGTIRKDGS